MKKALIAATVSILSAAALVPANAEEVSTRPAAVTAEAPAARPGRTTLFVVETDEDSAVESLNRISGEIDKGFTYSEDDTYESENHGPLSPFARQQAQDRRY